MSSRLMTSALRHYRSSLHATFSSSPSLSKKTTENKKTLFFGASSRQKLRTALEALDEMIEEADRKVEKKYRPNMFAEFKQLNDTEGKVAEGSETLIEVRKAKSVPCLKVDTLDGKHVDVQSFVTQGKPTLVLTAFKNYGLNMLPAWRDGFVSAFQDNQGRLHRAVQTVTLNVIEEWYMKVLSGSITRGLQKKIEKKLHATTFVHFGRCDDLRTAMALDNSFVGYAHLIDGKGRVRWMQTDRIRDLMPDVASFAISAQWTQLWSLSSGLESVQPMRRSAHAIAAFEDNLYVFGGISTNAADEDIEHNDTWKFDLVDRQWTEVLAGNNRPPNRFHHAGLLHANSTVNEFIVFGGLSLSSAKKNDAKIRGSVPVVQYNDIWRLSLTEGRPKWTLDPTSASPISDVPNARSEAGVVIYNDYLFMFGGISYDEKGEKDPVDFNDLWRYDLRTYTWKKMEPAGIQQPLARFSHSIALLHDNGDNNEAYLLVYSGRHLRFSSWTVLDDVWVYNLNVDEWISMTPSTSIPRAYTSIVTTKGTNIWFFGGYCKTQQSLSGYVYEDIVLGEFDFEKMKMEARHAVIDSNDASPPLRYNHRATLWRGDSMVIYGGRYQSQLGDIWAYNTTNAVTTDAGLISLPLDPETLIYVLGAIVFLIFFALFALLLRWWHIDRSNLRAQMRGFAVVRGVMKDRLDQLRITQYNRAERNPATLSEQFQSVSAVVIENEDVCPICLIDFEDGEDVRNLPCNHIFHVACIDEWLKRDTLCPMCKSNVEMDAANITVSPSLTHVARGSAVITPITS